MRFSGERIRQARELRALTQSEVAGRAGVTQALISQVEAGHVRPSADLVKRIVLATGFPIGFFAQAEPVHFPLGSLLYRRQAAALAHERTRILRHAEIVFEVIGRLEERLNLLPVRLPRAEDPATAARLTRSLMGVAPDRPFPSLIGTLERNGIIVIVLPSGVEHVDAFSAWVGSETKLPVIAVSSDRPGDRMRFSVAHELGHLVLHQAPTKPFAELEKGADEFAAELLLPEISIRQEITVPVTLSSLVALKPRWGVSVQALVKRARELQIITERQQRYLFQQLSARGWRKQEPPELAIAVEKPRLLRRMVELVYGTPIDFEAYAKDMHLSVAFAREMVGLYAPRPAKLALSRPVSSSSPKIIPFRPRTTR